MLPAGRAMLDFEIDSCNRDRARCVFGGGQGPGAAGKNHINPEVCEFRCEFWKKLGLVVSGPVFEFDVPSLDVTRVA